MAAKGTNFYKLPPGARAVRRGSVAARPWMAEYAKQQVVNICDFVAGNPWVRDKLGTDLDVSVRVSDDGAQIAFIFSKSGTWPEGITDGSEEVTAGDH